MFIMFIMYANVYPYTFAYNRKNTQMTHNIFN